MRKISWPFFLLLLVALFFTCISIFIFKPHTEAQQTIFFFIFLQIFLLLAANVVFIALRLRKVQKALEVHTAALQKEIRQKDEFISMTSHELKTPITSIKAFTQMLMRHNKEKDEFSYKYLQRVDQQVTMLTTMINDLLDASRIQNGKITYHKESFCYFDLLEEIVEQMRLISYNHRIILKGKSSKVIYGDRQRIAQLLINLITNAIKYSPGQKKIIITVTRNKRCITTEVQDFGIGIEKEDKKHIFSRFYQANQNSNHFTGLGLGLYIANEIARNHRAKIRVKSEKGKGSSFFFSIPSYKYAKD